MAYPPRQYQQAPPNPSSRYGEGLYNSAPQLSQNDGSHHGDVSNYNIHNRPYPQPAPRIGGGNLDTGGFDRNYGSPQRPEDDPAWALQVQQPYINSLGDGQIEQPQLRNRQAADCYQETRQYGAINPSPADAHYQNQGSGRGSPLPQASSRQLQYFPQSNAYETTRRSPRENGYTTPPPRTDNYHRPQQPKSRDRVDHFSGHNLMPEQMSQNHTNHQRQFQSNQDRSMEVPGDLSHYGNQLPQGTRQPRIANPTTEKVRIPPKERILKSLPLSPETVSWDNPFPTFPSNTKRDNHTQEKGLERSMADMNFNGKPQMGRPEGPKPATAEMRLMKNSLPDSRPHNFREAPSREGPHGISYPTNAHRNVQHPVEQLEAKPTPPSQSNHSWARPQPRLEYGRYSEDNTRDPSYRPPAVAQGDGQRSRTMPASVTGALVGSRSEGVYKPQANVQPGGYGMERQHEYRQLERSLPPHQAGPPMPSHSQSTEYIPGSGHIDHEPRAMQPGSYHSQQASLGEVFDSYYHSPHHSAAPAQGHVGQSTAFSEEDMPNFQTDTMSQASHKRGMIIDDHLNDQHALPRVPPKPQRETSPNFQRGTRSAEGFSRSKSSPNLQQQNTQASQEYSDGFNFELPGSVPAMYSSSPQPSRDKYPSTENDHAFQQPGQNGWQRNPIANHPQVPVPYQEPVNQPSMGDAYNRPPHSRPPDGRRQPPIPKPFPFNEHQGRELPKEPIPVNTLDPRSRPTAPTSSPDALPPHPVPIRAGLMQSPPSNQSPRPRPVRQYTDGSSSTREGASSQKPQISRILREEANPATVTYGELERLRQASRSNPSDSKTQLLLAKKLVEAASVLADEGGRADSKTSSRNREKYTSEATKLVKKLAQNGYPEAMFYLGDCFSRGSLGLQTDAKEAFGCYQNAAKAGHPQAAYRVAVCCEIGLDEGGGTKRDAMKAIQWYQRAATLGDPPAMYKLGVIQLKGLLGQPRDAKAAMTWLQRAAERADKENPHALHELALLYESPKSIEGVQRDEVHAKQLYLEAANLGYKFSQFRLGCAFEYGLLGCSIDPRQSIAWYSKAAVQDEHQSELALSGWYLTGSEGVLQQSDTEAYLWARKAAQAGLAKAEYAMGYFTEVGIGASANIEDAKRWYWRSASQNFPKARERLEDLRRGGAKMQKTRVSRSKMNKQSEGECSVM